MSKRAVVDFPQPDSPTTPKGLAFEDLKIYAIDGTHDTTALAENVFF